MSDTPFPLPEDGVASRLVAAFDADAKIPRALEALGPVKDRDVVLVDADRGFRARQLADLGARVTALVGVSTAAGIAQSAPGASPGSDAPSASDVSPAGGRTRSRRAKAAPAATATAPAVGAAAPAADSLRASLADLGARVRVAVGDAAATGLPDASADVVVALWTAYRPPADAVVAEADRILRPGGRLLVVHDYGRDDHVRAEPGISAEAVAWSRRDGWYLTHGFRVRVIHAFWTFADLDEARDLLAAAFGDGGSTVAAGLTRPRISHNVAVYHRDRGGVRPGPAAPSDGRARAGSERPAPARHDPAPTGGAPDADR